MRSIRRASRRPSKSVPDNLGYRGRRVPAAFFDVECQSLYFCCDGYVNESEFKEYTIAPVRISYDKGESVKLTVKPNGAGSVIFDPYPFDISPLTVSARARIVAPLKEKSEAACVDAYHKAPRELLTFQISA